MFNTSLATIYIYIILASYFYEYLQVSVVGVDTPSVDPGQTADYYCHRFLQPNQVPLLEFVANLDSIPQNDTTIVLGSIKMRRGTGGPTRILAFIDEKGDRPTNGASVTTTGILSVALIGAVRLLTA